MLVREESQFHIEAVEAEVEAIHRSREIIELPADGVPTLPVQAFVCGIKREEEYLVFLALHNKECKRNLVYSAAVEQKGKSGYAVAMKAALDACRTMGFAMESVNLKCSTAMREVVIHTIPVLLSPSAATKSVAKRAEELAELERLAMQSEENEAPKEAAAGLSPARRSAREKARQERQGEVKAAAMKLSADCVADDRASATRQAVERLLSPLFPVGNPAAESIPEAQPADKIERRLPTPAIDAETPAPASAAAPSTPEQSRGDALEIQRLARELDRLLAEKTAVEQRVAELSATARQAAERAESERSERERLEAAKELAEKRAEKLAKATRQAELRVEAERAEREQLLAAKAVAEQRAMDLADAAREAELRSVAFREEQERQVAEQAERVRIERERLTVEIAAMEKRAAVLVEAVREAEARVEFERGERQQLLAEKAKAEARAKELAEAVRLIEERERASRTEKESLAIEQAERQRAERESLAVEKQAAERRAAELTEAVQSAERQAAVERTGRERLLGEKAAAEQRAAELARAARRAAELTEIARQAAERAERERRERERLEVEKERVESRLQEQANLPRQREPVKAGTGHRREALPSLGGLFASEGKDLAPPPAVAPLAKSSSRPAVSGAFFQVDWDLAEIVYDTSADVLEVQQSVNMTQLSLEGFPNQYCTAYIVALKKRTGRQVHVAFRLATSDRVLVYSPPKPPHDQETYAWAMQEADRFLRVTGIETERLPLGKTPQSRSRALSQIPVLRRRPRTARNS